MIQETVDVTYKIMKYFRENVSFIVDLLLNDLFIIYQKTDILYGGFAYDESKLTSFTYSPIFEPTNLISILGIGKRTNKNYFELLSIFDMIVWSLLILSIIIFSITDINDSFND